MPGNCWPISVGLRSPTGHEDPRRPPPPARQPQATAAGASAAPPGDRSLSSTPFPLRAAAAGAQNDLLPWRSDAPACTREFRPVPSLTSLNRAQPEVAILSVTSDWDPIHDRPLAALILWSR